MRQSTYRKRLTQDLEMWVNNGWVNADNTSDILASLPDDSQRSASQWIGMAGALLGGLAIIALIADNWAGLARGIKFMLLGGVFAGFVVAAALTRDRRFQLANGLTLLAALVYAASIGLVGQSFNMPGEPTGAMFMAAVGGLALSAASRTPAAGLAGMVFATFWMFMSLPDSANYGWASGNFWIANLFLFAGIGLARLNNSLALRHVCFLYLAPILMGHTGEIGSLLTGNGIGFDIDNIDSDNSMRAMAAVAFLLFAGAWAGLAWFGHKRDQQDLRGGETLVGYGAWFGLLGFAALALPLYDIADELHRLVWIGVSIAVMWFGAQHSYGWVRAAGIVSLVTATFAIMTDLGLNLASATIIFGIASIGALTTVVLMNRNKDKETST